MPTKTFTRKNLSTGHRAHPSDGSPSLATGVEAVLSGRVWTLAATGTNVELVSDGADFTTQENTDLDQSHTDWLPDPSLTEVKATYRGLTDYETGRRIYGMGYTYAGKTFSLSDNAQRSLIGLDVKASRLTYPLDGVAGRHPPIRTFDDLDTYTVVDEADAHALVDAAFDKMTDRLAAGREVKTKIDAATTVALVVSESASYLGGGAP